METIGSIRVATSSAAQTRVHGGVVREKLGGLPLLLMLRPLRRGPWEHGLEGWLGHIGAVR